jgi:hypothetical protein
MRKNKKVNTKPIKKLEDETLMKRFLKNLFIKALVNFCLNSCEFDKNMLFHWLSEYIL